MRICSTTGLAFLSSMLGAIAMIAPAQAETTAQSAAPTESAASTPAVSTAASKVAEATAPTAPADTVSSLTAASGVTSPSSVSPSNVSPSDATPASASAAVKQTVEAAPQQPGLAQLPTRNSSPPETRGAGNVGSQGPELATKLQFVPASNPKVAADGRSAVTIEGEVLDKDGNAVLTDALVTLTTTAGKFVGADQDTDRAGFQVIAIDGKFKVQLQSNLVPQKVRVRAYVEQLKNKTKSKEPFSVPTALDNSTSGRSANDSLKPMLPVAGLEAYTQVEFIPDLRPTLVSGSINLRIGPGGTDYWGRLRDFLDPDVSGYRVDVKSAVFATGKVGDWLFTGAFNNTRPLNEDCNGNTRLFRDAQFCDQLYPTYGDSSTTDFLTPSIDSVYAKLERSSPVAGAGTDYLMWGDYTTGEFATSAQVFTATNRQLHGFKGNYNLGPLQITAMYGNNLNGFQRDGLAPNGTSGYYFLSRRLVVGGSEQVFVETEEIARPGTIVERRRLNRIADYEIDYDRGSLMFRRPILATEFDPFGRTLVRRIVVTYQYEGQGSGDAKLYAGRAQYNFSREFGKESWIAASYLKEDLGARNFDLLGVDALFPLGDKGRVIAEFADSTFDSIALGEQSGSAYRIEASGNLADNITARAFYRSVDREFTNQATYSFVPGQTRYGADVAALIGPNTSVNFSYDRERNKGFAPLVRYTLEDLFNPQATDVPGSAVDNRLTTIKAGVSHKLGKAVVGLDLLNRNRKDRIAPGRLSEDSTQLVSRASVPLSERLTFRAQNELNLGSSDALYPNRTTLALDWAAFPGVTMRLAQQFIGKSNQFKATSITSLDTILDQRLSEDTSITGRYSILGGVNGITNEGAVGLQHRLALSPGLRVNLGYERVFGGVNVYTGAGQQFLQPYAYGNTSSIGLGSGSSYSVGLEYTDSPAFKASARVEVRDSKTSGDSTLLSAGLAGKLSPSFTALARYQQSNFSNPLIRGLGDTINLKLGLAYRDPANDKFNALLRYEYRQNPDTIPTYLIGTAGNRSAQEHLFAVEALYAPSYRWEFYGKYALRATQGTYATNATSLFERDGTVSLGQLRTTYRVGYQWDVSGEVRWIGTNNLYSFDEVGFALEAGYYLTPNLRAAVGYSFGEANDSHFGSRDRDGVYATLSFKLNDLFSDFGIAPDQQKESKVTNPPTGPLPPGAVPMAVPPIVIPAPQTEQPQAQPAPVEPEKVRALY